MLFVVCCLLFVVIVIIIVLILAVAVGIPSVSIHCSFLTSFHFLLLFLSPIFSLPSLFLSESAPERKSDAIFDRSWKKIDLGLPHNYALEHLFSGHVTSGRENLFLFYLYFIIFFSISFSPSSHLLFFFIIPLSLDTITELVSFIDNFREKKTKELCFILKSVAKHMIFDSQEVFFFIIITVSSDITAFMTKLPSPFLPPPQKKR